MPRDAVIASICCCTGDAECYCGTACVGCESVCAPTPSNVCISQLVWDDHIGDVPGTGTGLLVSINEVWYFFDGTLSTCANVANPRDIDWASATRADECPAECAREITMEWTGSVTYGIACCVATPGTPDQYYYDAEGTGSQSVKVSPTMDLSGCFDQNKNTALEYMVAGTPCGESYLLNVEDENFRLNFRLQRDETNCLWIAQVRGGGTMQGQVPNEAAGTGWELQWTAPLSVCPPTTGWTLDEANSTLPVEQAADCDNAGGGYVTSFSVGSIIVTYL